MSDADQAPPDPATTIAPDPSPTPPPAPPIEQPDDQPNPYDQAVATIVPSGAPTTSDSEPDPYANAVGQIMSARKALLSSSLVKGQDTPVERQTKVMALSDKLNLPPDVVNQSYDALTRKDALQGIDNQKLLDDHPELAKWLVEPGNAGLAQGDMPQLQHLDTMAQALTGAYNPGGILPPGYMFSASGDGTIRGPLHEDGSPPVVYKGLDDLRSALEGQELTSEQQQQALQTHEQVLEQGFLPPAGAAGLQGSVGSSTAAVLTAANWWSRLLGGKGDATIGGADPAALRQFSTEGEAASEQAEPGFEGSIQRMGGEFAGDAPLYLAGGELAKVAEMGPTLLNLKEAAKLYGLAPSVGGLLDIVPALRALKATAELSPVPNSTYLQAAWKNAIAFSPMAARSGINTGDEHGAGYGTLDFLINAFGPGAAGHFGLAGDLAEKGTAAASGSLPVIAARLLGHSAAQGGAMAGTELVNAMHEVATGADPDALKSENLIPRLAQAGAMGSLLSSAFALPGAMGELTMRRQIASNTAMREADADASLVESYQASATMGRNEQHGRELLKSLIPQGQTTRYMQSDDLEGVAKQVGMTPEELATALNASDEYKQAKATGKVMHISTDDLVVAAAKMKDPKKITALLAARRSRPDGTNVNESLQFYQEAPGEISAMHAQMAADITNAAKGVQESDPIYRDVVEQATGAGRPEQEARDDARLMAARFNTMTQRWNTEEGGAVARGAKLLDPWEEYQAYKLKIQKEQPGTQSHDVLDNALDRIRSGKQPTAKQAYGPSLHEFLAKRGVKGEDLPESIADPNGHALEVAAQRAYEAGYIADEKTETLRDAIQEEAGGSKVYSEANRNADLAPAHELLNEIQATMKAKGIDIGKSNAEIKAALAGGEGPALQRYEQAAYHGTGNHEPYDRFDLNKVGGPGGEGAQAQGHGLYFAGRKEIAQYYRDELSREKYTIDGKTVEDSGGFDQAVMEAYYRGQYAVDKLRDNLEKGLKNPNINQYLKDGFSAKLKDIASLAGKKIDKTGHGRLYHVDIPDDRELLSWDKPLRLQTPEIQAIVAKIVDSHPRIAKDIGPGTLGEGIYHLMSQDLSPENRPGAEKSGWTTVYKGNEGDRAASEALRQMGIPGIRYLDNASRDKGEGTHNYVIFDDSRIKINKYEQEGRGSIEFNAERHFLITLTGKADLSTVLHESGHFWLEAMGDYAQRDGAPQQLKADYAKVLDFLGAKDRASIGVKHHEKFAQAIEQYLMEGKAPSPELRGTFQRFRLWLTDLYRQVKSLVTLTPEVKGVFDRMLATDDAIKQVNNELGTSTLFKDEAAFGLGPEKWKAYLQSITDARNQADARVFAQAMRVLRAERTRTFNREKDGVRADAAKLIEKRPPYVAESALVHGIDTDGSPTTVKLNRAQIERDYGRGTVGQLLRGITSEDGIPLEVAAEKFGFKNAAELWEAMHRKNFIPRKKAVDDLTDSIMQGRHPEMSSDALHEAAMNAVHDNSAHADVLSRESAALALKANRTPIAQEQFKSIAEGIVDQQNHRDVNHDSYVRAERMEHNKAADALLQNPPDYTAAFLHNQKAELAHACYRAAQEAEDVIADTAALMKKAQKTSERQKLGRAGGFLVTGKNGERMIAPDAAQAAALAKEYEGTTENFLQAMDRMTEMWMDRPTRYDMDYGAVHDLYREAATIMHQAKEAHELLVEGKREALSETVADLTDSQREAAKGAIVAVPRTKGTGYQFQTWLRQFDAGQRTISSICRSLDGDKTGGHHWNVINRPMNDAANDETVRKIANMQETRQAFDDWGKRGQKGDVFVPAVGEHMDLETRIGVMLNAGTKRNMERAMTGDRWSREQVNAIIATLDHKDIQLVKTIWANLEKKWPEISAVHQRINGIPPEKEPSIPVQTAFGTIDGGYYPILYDKDVGARAMELSLQKDHNPITGTPAAGFGISRVESTGLKLQYGFSALFRHNDDTAHFISHAELAQNLNKIINNKGFAQSVVDRFGMPTYQALTERIKNVLEGPRGPQNAFERGVRYVRQRTGLATMGFNLMTFISHGFGVFQNMERVGASKYIAAEGQILSDPKSAINGYNFIRGKSTMMANMKFDATPETAERIRQGTAAGVLSTIHDHALDLLHAALFHINSATWMAEYKTRMAETPDDESRAIALADQAVRDTQGTGQTVDKTMFQDKNEFTKVMSQYLSFFTRTYQALRPGVVNASLKDPQSIANLAKSFAMLVILPATTEALFRQAVRPSPDNDNSPKFWLEKLASANAEYLASTIFLGRELAGAFEGHGAQDPAAMRSMTSVTGTVKDYMHMLGNPDVSSAGKAARTSFLLAGQMFGLPATQIDHLIQGILYDAQQGTPDPRAPLFGPPPRR